MVEEYKDRLKHAMLAAMVSTPRLAEQMGLSYQAVRKVLQGGSRSFTAENNARAAYVLGVDPNWLATGSPKPKPGSKTVPLTPHDAPAFDLDAHPDLSSIRTVRLKLQAGVSGFAVEPLDANDGPHIFFRNDWLSERGYKAHDLLALKIGGMSMIPTLWPDDMVVVHTTDTERKDGEVYAVNYEGEAVIKRMKRERGSWWLSSDNADKARYPDKECLDGSCIVIGHVIYRQSERI